MTQDDLAGSNEKSLYFDSFGLMSALIAQAGGLAGIEAFAPQSSGVIPPNLLDTNFRGQGSDPDHPESDNYVPWQGVPGSDLQPLNIVIKFGVGKTPVYINSAIVKRLNDQGGAEAVQELIDARRMQGVLQA